MVQDDVWIIVPAFNEGARLDETPRSVCGRYRNVVVVNDGSDDDSSEVAARHPVWRIDHLVNCGQGAALQTGIDFAIGKGAQILVHPANLVLPWGQEAMKTRSIENRVFSVTANRIGLEKRGTLSLAFTGGSQIISPSGEVLVSAGDRSESLKVKEIDISEADNKNVTSVNSVIDDRVPSLYTPIIRKGKKR